MRLLRTVLATIALVSCRTSPPDSHARVKDDLAVEPSGRFGLCAALRGNAHYLFGHFGSLARIVEHYGAPEAMAGGSSSTITMLIYESVMKNRFVLEFPAGDERDQRIALLLKSFMGHVEVVFSGNEAMAVQTLAPLYDRAVSKGVFELDGEDYQKAATAMLELFNSQDLNGLVNPAVKRMLQNSDELGYASYPFKVQETKSALTSITAFRADDQQIFFREGIVNFAKLAEIMGRLAQFYAGYDPVDAAGMREFLSACGSAQSRGKTWRALTSLDAGGQSCGERYRALFRSFSKAYVGHESGFPNRLDETIGESLPSIVSTSIVEGQEDVAAFHEALKNYRDAKEPNFSVPFSRIRFGYWMPPGIAADTAARMARNEDLKSRKFLSLGSAPWRQALTSSPAEPGLARGVELIDGRRVSLGGWSDLAPVQVLKAAGCDKVVYITRESGETPFITQPTPLTSGRARSGLAEQLGMSEEERSGLYDLGNPDSSFARAVKGAEAVWCTDWNRFGDTELEGIFNEAYEARLVARHDFFTTGKSPYPNRISQAVTGCSF